MVEHANLLDCYLLVALVNVTKKKQFKMKQNPSLLVALKSMLMYLRDIVQGLVLLDLLGKVCVVLLLYNKEFKLGIG